MVLRLLYFCTLLLLYATSASAIDFTASGTILTVSYTEPIQNTDGSMLDDLAKTSVYYSLNGGADVKVVDVLASSPKGGASMATSITVPIAIGQSALVSVRATASDTSGNESVKSAAVTKLVDRLPPNPPQ